MKIYLSIFYLTLFSFSVTAAERVSITGLISKVQIMGVTTNPYTVSGDAIAMIYSDSLPNACASTGSNRNRVAISSNHPAFSIVVSAALAAKLSGQTVQLSYLTECTLPGNPAWDFAILTLH